MKRAALYARVSTPDQANTGTSLQSQLEACRAYAASQGYSVVMEAQDTYTGTTVTRTGLEGVMQAAREGQLDAVICHKIDRSSRDLADLLLLDKQLQSCGVLLDFVQDRRDRTPQGDLFFQIKGAFAQYELDQIRYRTMTGKEQRVRNGAVLGTRTTAYGYTLNRAARNLDIDEERAPYVRLIYRWYTEGNVSLSEVARRLNALHAPVRTTAKFWLPQAVRDIIRNDVYRGLWAYNKRRWQSSNGRGSRERPRSEWLFVPVPALVSDEMWTRAQEMLERNAYYSRRFKMGLKRALEEWHQELWIDEATFPTDNDVLQMQSALDMADIIMAQRGGERVRMLCPFTSTGSPAGAWDARYLLKDPAAYLLLKNWLGS